MAVRREAWVWGVERSRASESQRQRPVTEGACQVCKLPGVMPDLGMPLRIKVDKLGVAAQDQSQQAGYGAQCVWCSLDPDQREFGVGAE